MPDGAWVEPGFVAIVGQVIPRKGKAPMRAVMIDTQGGETITAALWGSPRIRESDTVEFSGKGITIKEFNNQPQVSVSDKADVRVVGGGIARNSVPAARRGPVDDTRGGSAEPVRRPIQSDFSTDGDPLAIAANNAKNFHQGMARQALLLAHCWIYSRRLFQKLQDECGFVFDKTQEENWIRSTATGMHIEANRKGLDSIVCNLDVKPPKQQAPAAPAAPREERRPDPPPAPDQTREPERFRSKASEDVQF